MTASVLPRNELRFSLNERLFKHSREAAFRQAPSTSTPATFFSDDDVDTASLFASQVAIVLANAQAYRDARELSSGLAEAMEHRAVMGQATGMLMAAQACVEDAAFETAPQSVTARERQAPARSLLANRFANRLWLAGAAVDPATTLSASFALLSDSERISYHLAKVRVAGSNPVVRSRKIPL